MRASRYLVAAIAGGILMCLLVGYFFPPRYHSSFPPELKPIVFGEIEKRGWKHYSVKRIRTTPDRWEVFVQRLPTVIGGDCTIEISRTNNAVIRVIPGV